MSSPSAITGNCADETLYEGARLLKECGETRDSRNGKVLYMPAPVTIWHQTPENCISFDADRDANPFFHIAEAIWMLGGCEHVSWLARILPNIRDFSDNGSTFNGPYGYRWINQWQDQLAEIVAILMDSPDSRRAVLQVWSPSDLGKDSKDLPCNTQAYFTIDNDSKVSMTVCNRSNDLIWGALGANVVHFSFLLSHIAAQLGREVGSYYQFTNNLHVYEKHFPLLGVLDGKSDRNISPVPTWQRLLSTQQCRKSMALEHFRTYCKDYVCEDKPGMKYDMWLLDVIVSPMILAIRAYKRKDPRAALEHIEAMPQYLDVTIAAKAWLLRRKGYEAYR